MALPDSVINGLLAHTCLNFSSSFCNMCKMKLSKCVQMQLNRDSFTKSLMKKPRQITQKVHWCLTLRASYFSMWLIVLCHLTNFFPTNMSEKLSLKIMGFKYYSYDFCVNVQSVTDICKPTLCVFQLFYKHVLRVSGYTVDK